MKLKTAILAAVLSTTVAGYAGAADIITKAPVKPVDAPFFLFSDWQISYWHEFNGAEPAIGRGIHKDIVTLTHFDVWKYGTNFVNIDFLKSSNKDPAAPWGGVGFAFPAGTGIGQGALEVYALYRGTLSWNALSGTKAFSFGPVKDVSFYYGFDANTKNTAFAPQKDLVVAGLQVAFAVPGYFNVAVALHKEWNHNGIVPQLWAIGVGCPGACAESVSFNPTVVIEAQYMQPLTFTGLPLRFSGFTNVVFPKGNDGFGTPTKTEILTDNRLTLDVGKLAAGKGDLVDMFVGYRYWQNKFGNDHTLDLTGGSTESTWYLGMALHAPK
jgi:nucleoside-specific outer membrane channel protein Tsx